MIPVSSQKYSIITENLSAPIHAQIQHIQPIQINELVEEGHDGIVKEDSKIFKEDDFIIRLVNFGIIIQGDDFYDPLHAGEKPNLTGGGPFLAVRSQTQPEVVHGGCY